MGRAVRYITTSKKQERLANTSKDLTVIIPTAGVGYRMSTYGSHALLEFQQEPLLQKQIHIIKKTFPHADIITVVGHEANKIMNNIKDVRFIENEYYATTNVLRSISLGIRASITERILIIYGDIFFNDDILNRSDNESWVIGDTKLKNTSVGIAVHNSHAVNFAYDLDIKWGKIAHLCGNELKIFKKIAHDSNNKKLLGYEALNAVIDKGGKFKCHILSPLEKIYEIDSYKDIQAIK